VREKETSVSEKQPDLANNLSHFSTLEAVPSIESCNVSESWESSKGILICLLVYICANHVQNSAQSIYHPTTTTTKPLIPNKLG
jgi:hypothetical protein